MFNLKINIRWDQWRNRWWWARRRQASPCREWWSIV